MIGAWLSRDAPWVGTPKPSAGLTATSAGSVELTFGALLAIVVICQAVGTFAMLPAIYYWWQVVTAEKVKHDNTIVYYEDVLVRYNQALANMFKPLAPKDPLDQYADISMLSDPGDDEEIH